MKNIQINYEEGAAEFVERLLGRAVSDEELAAAVGALDGSQLSVRIRKGVELAIDVTNEMVISQERWLRRDDSGELYIWNFRYDRARGHPGVGLASLVRQIKGASQLGIKRIECYAAGDPMSSDTGYHRWALYGYDAPLSPAEKRELSRNNQLAGATTLNELMLMGGEDWWKINGTGRKMIFDLNKDSSMMAVLKLYLGRKRPELLKELV